MTNVILLNGDGYGYNLVVDCNLVVAVLVFDIVYIVIGNAFGIVHELDNGGVGGGADGCGGAVGVFHFQILIIKIIPL